MTNLQNKSVSGNKFSIKYIIKKIVRIKNRRRISDLSYVQHLFTGKQGLEVGGPSKIFSHKGLIPLYKKVKMLDGCNFSNSTLWEPNITHQTNYKCFGLKKGIQYISDATDLCHFSDASFDFVISSNCLEHIANPLKALEEWIRVIKDEGLLLLVLPKKEFCFDWKRPITKFSHLLADYQNNTTESDLTHLDEILDLHDLTMDKPAGSLEAFKARSLKNIENRALHHHIFDTELLREIYHYFNLEVLKTYDEQEYVIIGRKKKHL